MKVSTRLDYFTAPTPAASSLAFNAGRSTDLNAVHRAMTRAALARAAVMAFSVFAVGATSAACIPFITPLRADTIPHSVSGASVGADPRAGG